MLVPPVGFANKLMPILWLRVALVFYGVGLLHALLVLTKHFLFRLFLSRGRLGCRLLLRLSVR